jgi:enoyl-CoA hydratase
MDVVQEIAPNKAAALEVAIDIANWIAACGPLGIKATLAVAHLAINHSSDVAAYTKLQAEFVKLFGSGDFIEGARLKLRTGLPSSTGDKYFVRASPRQFL